MNVLLKGLEVGVVLAEVGDDKSARTQSVSHKLEHWDVLVVSAVQDEQVDLGRKLVKGREGIADANLHEVSQPGVVEVLRRPFGLLGQDLRRNQRAAAKVPQGGRQVDRGNPM